MIIMILIIIIIIFAMMIIVTLNVISAWRYFFSLAQTNHTMNPMSFMQMSAQS